METFWLGTGGDMDDTEIELFSIIFKQGVYFTLYQGLAIYTEVTFYNGSGLQNFSCTMKMGFPS